MFSVHTLDHRLERTKPQAAESFISNPETMSALLGAIAYHGNLDEKSSPDFLVQDLRMFGTVIYCHYLDQAWQFVLRGPIHCVKGLLEFNIACLNVSRVQFTHVIYRLVFRQALLAQLQDPENKQPQHPQLRPFLVFC